MPTLYAYAPDAISFNSSDGTWTLRADFNPALHRVELQISDDDNIFDGDSPGDEIGYDTNQVATVYDTMGNPLASGQVYDEAYYEIEPQSVSGGPFYIDVVEIGGAVVGYLTDEVLVPGETYDTNFVDDVDTVSAYSYSDFVSIACFGPGTEVATPAGPRPVETLGAGSRVLTRDHGVQPLRALRSFRASALQMLQDPGLLPVELLPAGLGQARGARPLLVSCNHRVLLQDATVELHFGAREVLASAGHLKQSIPALRKKTGITYFHLLLDAHELVLANGLWCESLYLGDRGSHLGSPVSHASMQPVHTRTIRPCLKRWEVELWDVARRDAAPVRKIAA